MTIAEINSALQARLPTIILSPATFGQDRALTPFLQQFFPETGGAVTIVNVVNYRFDAANGVIRFSGTGQGGPFDNMAIDPVVIKVMDNVIEIAISATAADGWTLYHSFPALNAPVIQKLPLSKPKLYWSTYDSDADETIQGFFVVAQLDLQRSLLNPLSALLPGLQAPEIYGQFDMVGSNTSDIIQLVPSGYLTIDASDSDAQLGPLTLSGPTLQIFSNADFNIQHKVWQADNYLRLSSSIKFQGADGNTNYIIFQADFRDLDSDIVFDAQMDLPIGASLTQLENLVNIDSKKDFSLQNKDFPIKSTRDLNFKDLRLVFSPKTQKVKMIALEVGMSRAERWPLWDNVYLQDIDILFHIFPSSGDNPTTMDGEFSGKVNDWLQLRAGFSSDGNYTFYGALAKPVSIADLYTFFTQQTNPDLPKLTVETLDFQLQLSKKDNQSRYGYGGEFNMVGQWPIVSEPIPFSLDGLLFKINHEPGGATTIEAGSIMVISDYSLSVEGQYGSDEGWTLSGDLDLKDEKKNLTEIAGKIDETFKPDQAGARSIPNFLTSWLVESLHTHFNTKKKDFHFTIEILNDDAPGLDLLFGIHLTHNDARFTKEFDAVAKYVATEFDIEFDLIIKEEDNRGPPPSKKFTLTGDYKSTKAPTLSELLEAISKGLGVDANLPQELHLDAAINGLAVAVEQTDSGPTTIELAGEFKIKFEGSDLNLYLAYTNEVASDTAFTQPILVLGKPAYVLGVSLGGLFDLSQLPVVGKILGMSQLAVDKLGFFYTNASLGKDQKAYFKVPQVSGGNQLAPDPTQSVVTQKGFNLVAVFGKQVDASGSPLSALGTMNIPVNTGAPPRQEPPGFTGQPVQPASPIHWIDVGKTFGPVSLRQVGLNYSDGEATIGFSAGMNMTGFMLDLQGLSITFPMPLPEHAAGSRVSFDLEGLALNINKGGLQVGGAFLKAVDADKTVSYYGEVIVQAGGFGFTALGGYSPNANPASFFIYANIEVPLGGPPFLFITGLAGGFGINRNLKLATVDGLSDCPLIPGNPKTPAQGSSPADTIKSVLPALQGLFTYDPGEYWVAAGIRFTSFEMIHAFALLTVSFGVELQIGLIGTCSISVPAGENEVVIAYAEIDIVADFTASTGALAVDGRLSPASYIYGGFVHLSGGFAFYTWFGGAHKGDFVLSLGGYHPAFVKPDYYPSVPRLGMNFGLGPFEVIGQAYFALTPGMMMAGIGFSATWNSESLKVWFDLGLDFLIGWAPFHYEGDAYVHMGISLDLGLFTIHLHIGADLHVWGPKFGGTAHVDLDVLSFTIKFGADRKEPAAVDWITFKSKFLPADTQVSKLAALRLADGPPPAPVNIVKANVTEGLLGKNKAGYDWIVDPESFVIQTNSTIPSNHAVWNPAKPPVQPSDANLPNTLSSYRPAPTLEQPYLTYPAPLPVYAADQNLLWNPNLHIKPMGLEGVNSFHTVSLSVDGRPVPEVTLQPVLLDSNQALWGRPGQNTDPNSQALAKCMLSGFLITPIRRIPDAVSNVQLIDLLFQFGYHTNFAYTAQALDTRFTVRSSVDGDALNISVSGAADEKLPNSGGILSVLTKDWVSQQRVAVLGDLRAHNGFSTFTAEEIDLRLLASETALTHWPVVELMGA